MTIKETIESLQLLLMQVSDEGEKEKITYINDVKPSSTIFVLSTAIDILQKVMGECMIDLHDQFIHGYVCGGDCTICDDFER